MNHAGRLRALRAQMKQREIEALLLTHLPDVRYFTGFTGSNAVVAVTARRAVLYTDGRYTVQAREQVKVARVIIAAHSALREACNLLESLGVGGVAFDPEQTTVSTLHLMRSALKDGRRRRNFFRPLDRPLPLLLRLVKDEDELRIMEKAALEGCRLFEELLPYIESGMAETAVAARLEFAARTLGAEGMSFETIVASGPRSALPHGHATSALLPRNGFVTLDFGIILDGYCSDMTRTVFMGTPNRRQRFAYDAVLDAQLAAVEAVRPGATCGEVDEAARSVLRKAGLAEHFTHSTGHGVGLEIHEAPRIAAGQAAELVPGMVITIEPGIYIAGKFGIRIEDMVAVTRQGGKVLTPATKALLQL